MPDMNDLKGLVDKAEGAAKKAGITGEDLEKYKDKAIDVAKDFFDKKILKDGVCGLCGGIFPHHIAFTHRSAFCDSFLF